MKLQRPPDGARIVVFSGGGLSAASEVPAHRDAEGRFEGRSIAEIAAPRAWETERDLVRRYYDQRRVNCVHVLPNDAHDALSRLQHRWGARRVVLATTAIDGLLVKAGAVDVIELQGSLWRIRCEADPDHPHLPVAGPQPNDRRCAICKALMRPDVRWEGEPLVGLERVQNALDECVLFLCVGAHDLDPQVAEFAERAKKAGARTIEVNPVPNAPGVDHAIAQGAEDTIPQMVAEWLGEV